MTTSVYISLYERRIELVQAALTGHSKLSTKDARDLAVHVLRSLDHIPEQVR
ncbi:DUF6307 family protein [Lentzea indica]|jgi:hypothetical protein|uniref:DUF6307 family protein n=1 Tax=Lentzea indica TaxID=2604800 RepID=UPI0014390D9E|nr:DUF6307 family protein [Lentzea indica]